jgi:hypothetical protein
MHAPRFLTLSGALFFAVTAIFPSRAYAAAHCPAALRIIVLKGTITSTHYGNWQNAPTTSWMAMSTNIPDEIRRRISDRVAERVSIVLVRQRGWQTDKPQGPRKAFGTFWSLRRGQDKLHVDWVIERSTESADESLRMRLAAIPVGGTALAGVGDQAREYQGPVSSYTSVYFRVGTMTGNVYAPSADAARTVARLLCAEFLRATLEP